MSTVTPRTFDNYEERLISIDIVYDSFSTVITRHLSFPLSQKMHIIDATGHWNCTPCDFIYDSL